MKRSSKLSVLSILIAVMIFAMFPRAAFANSALRVFYGRDSTGAIVKVENEQIVVEREILTFDLAEFPKNYYASYEEYMAYSGRFSAEYHFYNNSDLTVTATLLFPFGRLPYYAYYGDSTGTLMEDLGKYEIYVDGQVIEKTLRHTYSPYYGFDVDRDLPKIKDDYYDHEFFYPELKITKYVFSTSALNTKEYSACLGFEWNTKDEARKMYIPSWNTFSVLDDGVFRIGKWIDKDGDTFEIYVLGEPFDSFPNFAFYERGPDFYEKDSHDVKKLDGTITMESVEELTFKEYVFRDFNEDWEVSRVDWYNAAIDAISRSYYGTDNLVELNRISAALYRDLTRWYEYEIEIEPKGRIVNTVVAPMYPQIDGNYEPTVYDYTYYLTPASTFGNFKNLEIYINTPYYLVGANFKIGDLNKTGADANYHVGEFERTESGYKLILDELPNDELYFRLSTAEKPKIIRRFSWVSFWMTVVVIVIIAGFASVIAGVGFAVYLIVRRRKQKKEIKNESEKENN